MDRGIQRRLIVVPFNRVVPPEERIEAIGRRVADDEADLLLAWAIDGAARLIRQRNFSIPGSSKTALFDWIYGADPVLAWLDERVEVRPSIGDPPNVRTRYAYEPQAWAVAEGFRRDALPGINGFVQRITANAPGVKYRRTSEGRYFTAMLCATSIRHPPTADAPMTRR